MNKIFIFGAGGHAKVVADIAELNSFDIVGFVDPYAKNPTFLGKPILKTIDEIPVGEFSAIVALGDNGQRSKVVKEIMATQSKHNLKFVTLIHPKAVVARSAQIGLGTVVMAGAVINPEVKIDEHAIINTGSVVDHDCRIYDFASIAPGAVLGGNVKVFPHSVVSIGAVCKHNVEIAQHSVVGANSYVHKNIPEYSVAYGVPAKVIKQRLAGEKYL